MKQRGVQMKDSVCSSRRVRDERLYLLSLTFSYFVYRDLTWPVFL